MGKSQLLGAILVAVIVISAIEAFAFIDVTSKNAFLSRENSLLKSKYAELDTAYKELNNSHRELDTRYSQLISQFQSLNESYRNLEVSFSNLTSTYNVLNEAYSDLSKNYSLLEATFKNINSSYSELSLNYVKLNETYNSYVSAYEKIRSKVNFFILHPKEEDRDFITPDDSLVASKVEEITGGWSDPSDWDEYWKDIKALYDWVVNNIKYRSDSLYPILPSDPTSSVTFFGEMSQFPNQTLELGKGDCEDMAILLASMIYKYGNKQYWVECILITNHAAVYIPVDKDKICILDPAGKYYTNTGWPLNRITSKDTSTEVHDWLSYWDKRDPEGTPHEVQWIFSAYIYKYFGNTIDFINWLYTRAK